MSVVFCLAGRMLSEFPGPPPDVGDAVRLKDELGTLNTVVAARHLEISRLGELRWFCQLRELR